MNIRDKVIANDLRVMDVATYVATKGNTVNVKGTDIDAILELQDKVQNLMKEYKMRIRKGSFTLAELEEMEYSKYGILEDVPLIEDTLSALFNKKSFEIKENRK